MRAYTISKDARLTPCLVHAYSTATTSPAGACRPTPPLWSSTFEGISLFAYSRLDRTPGGLRRTGQGCPGKTNRERLLDGREFGEDGKCVRPLDARNTANAPQGAIQAGYVRVPGQRGSCYPDCLKADRERGPGGRAGISNLCEAAENAASVPASLLVQRELAHQ